MIETRRSPNHRAAGNNNKDVRKKCVGVEKTRRNLHIVMSNFLWAWTVALENLVGKMQLTT